MERRAFSIEQQGRTLSGYAARFNSEASIGDFIEVIRPGAFARTLAAPTAVNIRAIYEHDDKALLGRVGSGTLRLSEDDVGLRFELDLPDTSVGRDLAELVKRGDVAGCSFGFMAGKDTWLPGPLRELREVDLHEITLTARPAYSSTSVSLRSLAFGRLNLARRYLEAIA